jgi:uncharacterized membrane protein YebE (DUF533 family)
MFDPQKLLEQFLGGGKPQDGQQNSGQKPGLTPDFMKGLATGGVAGGLAGVLLGGKTSKKLAKGGSASSRADGCCVKGKTRGKVI